MEFHAVIVCGQGARLEPVTNEQTPKALLPVGNKPIITHTLEWCARAAFKSVTIFANSRDAEKIAAVAKTPVVAANNVEETLAKLQALDSDFVVMPVDFITDIDPKTLVNAHRSATSAIVSGFYYKNTIEQIDKKLLDPDLLISSNDQLLDVYAKQQTKANKYLDLRMAMLWKFPNVRVTTDVLASGIYFCRRDVIKLLSDIDGIETHGKPLWKLIRDIARRTWQHSEILDPVQMHHLDGVFIRANILPAYIEANRHTLKLHARDNQARKVPPSKDGPAIGPDSIVDATAVVGDKSSVKRTVIGTNCKIGAKCRLNGCVILPNVVIEDGVILENTVLASNAIVRTKSKLTSCTVESGYVVATGLEAKNEILKGAIDLEAVEEYHSSDSSDQGSTNSEYEEYEVSDADDDLFDRS